MTWAKRLWGEIGWVTRATAILGLLMLIVAVLTAFKGGVEAWLVPRRDYELRYIQDSTLAQVRYDNTRRGQKYTNCLVLTPGTPDAKVRTCLHLTIKDD